MTSTAPLAAVQHVVGRRSGMNEWHPVRLADNAHGKATLLQRHYRFDVATPTRVDPIATSNTAGDERINLLGHTLGYGSAASQHGFLALSPRPEDTPLIRPSIS